MNTILLDTNQNQAVQLRHPANLSNLQPALMPRLSFPSRRGRRSANETLSRNRPDLLGKLTEELERYFCGADENSAEHRGAPLGRTGSMSQKSSPVWPPEPTQGLLAQLSAGIRHSAVVAERNRIARDMHDTLAQGFTGVIVQLGAAEQALSRNLATEAASRINRACELAQESLRQTRRSIGALRSQVLEEKNLYEALNESFQKMAEGTALQVKLILSGQCRKLPVEHEENLLRIGQEALTNTIRHARAGEFKAKLVFGDQEVQLLLRDNGCGFEPAAQSERFGLKGMRERVESIGGSFSLNSTKGAGTEICVSLPIQNENRKRSKPRINGQNV
jgi:signal transduction histidine kinase